MNCSLSGNNAVHPVVSPRSGRVFERSVIEAYIREHASDPVSGDPLNSEELIPLSTQPILPKTPTTASIPGLLLSLQNEYDALVLETYELRQELQKTRAELSSALIRNDACLRVVARLTSERDESRTTLYELNVPASKRRAVEYPTDQLNVGKIVDTTLKLSKARKIANKSRPRLAYSVMKPLAGDRIMTGIYAGPLNFTHQALVVAGSKFYQLPFSDITQEIVPVASEIMEDSPLGTIEFDDRLFITTERSVLENNHPVSGSIPNARYHPAGYILGVQDNTLAVYDKSFNLVEYDSKLTLESFEVHPDGDLIFCCTDSAIDLYSFKREGIVASYDVVASQIAFSNNGYTVALINATGLYLCDLRNDSDPKCIDSEVKPNFIAFDGTGRLLALLDEDGSLHVYELKNKTLERLEVAALDISGFSWLGHNLLTVTQVKEGLDQKVLFTSL